MLEFVSLATVQVMTVDVVAIVSARSINRKMVKAVESLSSSPSLLSLSSSLRHHHYLLLSLSSSGLGPIADTKAVRVNDVITAIDGVNISSFGYIITTTIITIIITIIIMAINDYLYHYHNY